MSVIAQWLGKLTEHTQLQNIANETFDHLHATGEENFWPIHSSKTGATEMWVPARENLGKIREGAVMEERETMTSEPAD